MSRRTRPLLSLRAALILGLSMLGGGAVAALAYADTPGLPRAIVAGLAASGAAVTVLQKIVGDEVDR